jgi:cytochrome c biogenesis protein CcmG/thiol:disulfide interchange protein DsbE
MAKPEDDDVARWAEAHLARLTAPEDWSPDLARNRARVREQLAHQRQSFRTRLIIAATAAVLVLPLAEVPVVRALAQRCGEWLLTVSNVDHQRTRVVVPDFNIVDAQGQSVTLSAFRGKVVLLTLWTTTCGQCETEMSWFTSFQDAYRDQGFAVLGVAVEPDGWARVTPYLSQRPVNYQVVIGDRDRAQTAIGPSIPTTLILDRQGRIAVRHVGFCSRTEYLRDIQKVLAE